MFDKAPDKFAAAVLRPTTCVSGVTRLTSADPPRLTHSRLTVDVVFLVDGRS